MTRHIATLVLFVSLLCMGGCGGGADASPRTAPQNTATADPTLAPTSTPDSPTQTLPSASPTPIVPSPTRAPTRATPPTAAPPPTATAVLVPTRTAIAQPGHVVHITVRPLSVIAGSSLSADVTTSGEVRAVEIYLAAAAAGTSGPVTLTLAQTAPGMWTATGAAPATPGEYHYSVGLFGPSGRYPVVANDAWVVQVTGPGTGADGTSGSTSAQPIPPNLLLAPPFSYGNPVAADFTANGRSIHGSEVVSTARPDVPASTVAQFYLTRLPRAGWTITQSQLPGASGRSFTIAAAAGTQVCFIDFSAATVHVFYGTAGQ